MATLSSLIAPYQKVPLSLDNDVLLQADFPLGISDSDFTSYSEHGALVVAKTTLGALSKTLTWILGTDGYAHSTGGYAQIIGVASAPAYTTRRKYEIWGKTKDGALTNASGVRVLFNYTDLNNHWLVDLEWITASDKYQLKIYENTAGTPTTRASVLSTVNLDVPVFYHLIVYEQGDSIIAQATLYENDSLADNECLTCYYTVGSRPSKSVTAFYFTLQAAASDEWKIRGFKVSDIL